MHHYLEFFRAIRKSIAEDTLPEMIELIEKQKQVHDALIAASEQKNEAEIQEEAETEADLKKNKIVE